MTEISRKTFDAADADTQLGILFDLQIGGHEKMDEIVKTLSEHPNDCNKRFEKLEKRGVINTVVSGIMAFGGGAAAVFGKSKL